jgi:hypothetical protein
VFITVSTKFRCVLANVSVSKANILCLSKLKNSTMMNYKGVYKVFMEQIIVNMRTQFT